MKVQLLSPGVKEGGDAQVAAQAVGAELEQRGCGALEEQRIEAGGIEQDQGCVRAGDYCGGVPQG